MLEVRPVEATEVELLEGPYKTEFLPEPKSRVEAGFGAVAPPEGVCCLLAGRGAL